MPLGSDLFGPEYAGGLAGRFGPTRSVLRMPLSGIRFINRSHPRIGSRRSSSAEFEGLGDAPRTR